MKRISTDLHLNEKKDRKSGKQGEQVTGADVSGKSGRGFAPKVEDETGGPSGLEPTRFGDWEVNGRCSDF